MRGGFRQCDDAGICDHAERNDIKPDAERHRGEGDPQPVLVDHAGGDEDGAANRWRDRRQQRVPEHEQVCLQRVEGPVGSGPDRQRTHRLRRRPLVGTSIPRIRQAKAVNSSDGHNRPPDPGKDQRRDFHPQSGDRQHADDKRGAQG